MNSLINEKAHNFDVSTAGCCMQWSPLFRVFGIHIGPVPEQKAHNSFIVINGTLKEKFNEMKLIN
jgi:hypothetical protein